jgi:hypothetical protein
MGKAGLYGHFKLAFEGGRVWKRIKKQYKPDKKIDALFLFPHDDMGLNMCVINNMEQFINRKLYLHALLIVRDEETSNAAGQLLELNRTGKYYVCVITDDEMIALCKFYRLVGFFHNIRVVSLDEPYGSRGLIGKKDYTIDFIVKYSILGW